MTDMTYDAEADAVYIPIGPGKVERTRRNGHFSYDFDDEGRIVGIEIKSASKLLASGDWKKARPPPPKETTRRRGSTAELHKGFLFIRRSSPRDVESQ
jgi:uncharacterized protein YuzE